MNDLCLCCLDHIVSFRKAEEAMALYRQSVGVSRKPRDTLGVSRMLCRGCVVLSSSVMKEF